MKNKSTFCMLFTCILFLLFSCSEPSDYLPEPIPEPDESSNVVTYEEAVKNLDNILECIDGTGTRGGSSRRVVANHYTIGEPINTRSEADEETEPFLYIFNFEDDEGFAIVSGDKRTVPIFAVTDSGSLNSGDVIDNPGLAGFLINLEEGWHDVGGGVGFGGGGIYTDFKPPYDTTLVRNEYSDWRYEKIANPNASYVDWGQEEPYNNLAPINGIKRDKAGCVATAVAQLCAYHRYPAFYNGYWFNWTEMVKHRPWGTITNHEAAHGSIARFFQQISTKKNLDMDFGQNTSSSKSERIPRTLENLGYSKEGVRRIYQTKDVISELRAGYPVLISGMSKKKPRKVLGVTIWNDYSGHTWLTDRYLDKSRTITTYVLKTGEVLTSTQRGEGLIYCNWGWDGRFNGYFVSGVFNVDNPYPEPDTRSGEANNFQYKHKMIIWIRK